MKRETTFKKNRINENTAANVASVSKTSVAVSAVNESC